MSTADQVHPDIDSWVAAVHASEDDFVPLASGVVVDERTILTCAHVAAEAAELWVAFPKAEDGGLDVRRRVERVVQAKRPTIQDLALLVLSEPVPSAVTAAPLRSPRSSDLTGRRWWAYGFPGGDPVGNSADGSVGSALAYGWVRLDAQSRYHVQPGFSGGGLWSPDYQAVIAIVGQANDRGDGRAITLRHAITCFPQEYLGLLTERFSAPQSGEVALAAWGWSLSEDPEMARHWRPRARGVSIDSERGYRFRGRTRALRTIVNWLDHDRLDRRVLVVTGAPGSGKSAVLGRIVTTADPDAVRQLPDSDTAVRASPRSVACAVHAKGKTALEIATEIARAASAALPERTEDFAPTLREALVARSGHRFSVVIDALDEAASPSQARAAISKVILPLTETCSDVGASVIVGSRRRDDEGDLLAAIGSSQRVIDLDDRQFFAGEDLAAYALATLQLAGDERPRNPYLDDDIARPVADRIAELSDANFLVAGLTARTHGLYDDSAVDPVELSFTPTVDAAMREYLRRVPPIGSVSAHEVLTALAFAEAPGMPCSLWQAAVQALGLGDVLAPALSRFARSSAANFLVESSGADGEPAEFRLFHQALNDTLLRERATVVSAAEDERALTRAFLALGRGNGWKNAPAYLLRSLGTHATHAGMVDDILVDDNFLLYADLLRLLPLAGRATSVKGQQRVRLLRLAPRSVITADAPNRTAIFSVTEALEGLGDCFARSNLPAPYVVRWGAATHSTEQLALEGHRDWISSVCTFTLHDRAFLASASDDRTVRIWDPATGIQHHVLRSHTAAVNAVCAFAMNDRPFLASASSDRTVRIWDPATGRQQRALRGHDRAVRSLCAFILNGRAFLASASDDRTVRIWDPATGIQHHVLESHKAAVNAVCAFTHRDRAYLATTNDDATVRIWDPSNGSHRLTFRGQPSVLTSLCAFTYEGQPRLAVGDKKGARILDPVTGLQQRILEGHPGAANAVCAFELRGRPLIATAGGDQSIRIWDPATGRQQGVLTGHTNVTKSMCSLTLDGQLRLATGSGAVVKIWNPAAGLRRRPTPQRSTRHVSALCGFDLNGRTLLASSSDETVVIRDPATGSQELALDGQARAVRSLCAFTVPGRTLLATGSSDETIRIWDPTTGRQQGLLEGHSSTVRSLCAFTVPGRTLLASGSDDRTVRIWDPATGGQLHMLEGHAGVVWCVCDFQLHGRPLLATAGTDGIIRIWDAVTGIEQDGLEGHAGTVRSVRTFIHDGRPLLVTAGADRTIRIWDPAAGAQLRTLEGSAASVKSICTFTLDGQTFIAAGGNDRTARIWVHTEAAPVLVAGVRDEVFALTYAADSLVIGTATGLLAIRPNPDTLHRAVH